MKWRRLFMRDSLTRFMIKVRSPWASSSGVGGSGRFGGPPWVLLAAVLSVDKIPIPPPGLREKLRRIRSDTTDQKTPRRSSINNEATHSGFGGSLASSVPSFLVRSFGSSGSLSESDVSIGSNGLTGWLLLLLGVVCLLTTAAAGCERLLRGGASGCDCDCWGEIPNSFNCAASMSKS